MIDDELMKKIDSIEDLPISEEMLGAYLEGNLHGSEFREISNLIHENSNLSDLAGNIENDIYTINDMNFSIGAELESSYEYDVVLADSFLQEIGELEFYSFIDTSSMNGDLILHCTCHNYVNDENEISIHHSDVTEHDQNLNHQGPELDLSQTNIFD